MPSDRERLSYDASQRYRSVVAQQGRVTVPADFNETQEILTEETRVEALDFVGPVGTPDDGYAISFNNPTPTFDFNIGAGTMYVGGLRVTLPPGVTYLNQPDWLDAAVSGTPTKEYVFLMLEEREVGAVEDSALRDVALGGPDTCQRTRLLQRVERTSTTANVCAAALAAQQTAWNAQGWSFDANTMQLTSAARLQVGFDTSGPTPGPCEPAASGGYLGAENQLIRVRISGTGKFVWGFDNASFLYRVDVVDNQTVKLETSPVDLLHFPRVGQVVELLRAETLLANGEYVAAAEGQVVTLADAYNPDTQTIKLPSTIPPQFTPPDGTPRLFLRVWEKELSYVSGTAVTLGNTGLTVTITSPAGLHTGDFWSFAARPSTPVKLYQNLYTTAPQPPEGPRRWVCPLAVIQWSGTEAAVTGSRLADCREKFDNLVELTKRPPAVGGCCTVTLKPSDLETESFETVIAALPDQVPARICLKPGTYKLKAPVVLKRNDISIEACPGRVILRSDSSADFRHGMVIVLSAERVALKGLTFALTESPLEGGPVLGLNPDEMDKIGGPKFDRIGLFVAIRLVESSEVTIECCHVIFPGDRDMEHPSSFGAGVYASGPIQKLVLRGNRFDRELSKEGASPPGLEITDEDFRMFFGYLQAPVSIAALITLAGRARGPGLKGQLTPSRLEEAAFEGNTFDNLAAALYVHGDVGKVQVTGNDVKACYSGFWLLSNHTVGFFERLFKEDHKELGKLFDISAFLTDPVLQIGGSLARSLPQIGGPVSSDRFNEVPVDIPQPFNPIPNTATYKAFMQFWSILGEIELRTIPEATTVQPELIFTRNVVETEGYTYNEEKQPAGPALTLWGDDLGKDGIVTVDSAAIVQSNDFRSNRVRCAAAFVMLFGFSTVTGNVILLPQGNTERFSLLVFPARSNDKGLPGVAITGNVLRGPLSAPDRPIPAPLNTWDVLNTVMRV
jgi:hypothetical protein